MNPYQELARALRDAGVDEQAVFGILLDRANDCGDDHAEVFAALYGNGSVLSPSEAL
jgi:hypothetical protein